MSLGRCLITAGKNISRPERDEIVAAAAEHGKVHEQREAEILAVHEALQRAINDHASVTKLIKDSAGQRIKGGEVTGGAEQPGGGKTEPKPPEEPKAPKPPEEPKEETKPPEEPQAPKRPPAEQELLDVGEAIKGGDGATIAKIVYTGIRDHEEADVPVVLPEDRLIRLPVKLAELKAVEARLAKLKFRVTDKLQETKESERLVVSAIFMPEKGKITGGGERLRDNEFSRPKKDAPEDDWDKALDKFLVPLHASKLLDPAANEKQSFGNFMFKEAVYSLVDYPLSSIARAIRRRFAGYFDVKSDREVLKSAMKDDVQFEFMQARAAEYKARAELLAKTLTEHDRIADAWNAFKTKYIDTSTGTIRYTKDGDDLYALTNGDLNYGKVLKWYEKFSANEDSTDQTDRVNKKDPDKPPPLGDIKRVGMKDHRQGRDITDAEEFVKAFGFRGVKFGEWVNQAERQAQMNLAYDSLMDLSDLTGIPPTMLGLKGKLGLGIGAYGNEYTKAAAFYLPSDEIFNLTKDNGRGTVGHEWFHAFEDIVGKYQADSEKRSAAMALFNSLPELFKSRLVFERADGAMRQSLANAANTSNRNEPPKTAFSNFAFRSGYHFNSDVVQAIREATGFYRAARAMDGDGKSYWAKTVELLARGFETFLYDKAEGGTPFLVGPTRADGVMTPANGYKGTPYPRGKEREVVADMYRELFKWIDPETLEIKGYKRELSVIELPDGRFTVLDQNGLGTDRSQLGAQVFADRKMAEDAQRVYDGKTVYPTVEQIHIGKVSLQAVEFAKNIDKIMEEMGLKPWPEIRNGSMAESMFDHLRTGWWPEDNRALREFAAKAHKIRDRELNPLQMKEAQEDFEAAMGRYANQIIVDMRKDGADTRAIYDRMVALYKAQPRLSERTMESSLMQAYSTPLPISFLSGMLSRVMPSTKLFDPTGGNGLLTITADPTKVTTIEKLKNRIRNLKLMKFGKVFEGDFFERMKDVRNQESDVVHANPPFESLRVPVDVDSWDGTVYPIGRTDQLIAAQSLRAMADKGRAILILAANKEPGMITRKDTVFLSWLYSNYNVADHFEISGELYTRQGAQWPIRVLVIAGRNHTEQVYTERQIDRVDSWDNLWSRYEQAISNSERVLVDTQERTGGTGRPNQQPGGVPGSSGGKGAVTGGPSGGTGKGGATDQPATGGTGTGPTSPGGRPPAGGATGGVVAPGAGGVGGQPRTGPTGGPGNVQGGNRGAGGTNTGLAGPAVTGGDIDNWIDEISGAAPTPPAAPKKVTGGAEGGKVSPPQKRERGPRKPKAEGETKAPPTPPVAGPSVLDDIPGLGDLLGGLDDLVSGKTPDPKVIGDLTADKPTGSQEEQAIDDIAEKTGMSETMARASMAPTILNLPDILSAQRRDAEALLRDIRRANDAALEARENPTAAAEMLQRPMFSMGQNEDSKYSEYLPVFKAVWEKIRAAISDVKQAVQTFAKGLIQRYGQPIVDYVKRFVKDVLTKKPIEIEEGSTETQDPYTPRSQAKNSQGVRVPTNQAARLYDAMDRIERVVGDFDDFVQAELGYGSKEELADALGDYQIDALAMGIHRMKNGGAFIVGDDTGVGKGRTAAAAIAWAAKNGKTPVFITFKKALYGDMYRDLHDIGRPEVARGALITDVDDEVKDDDGNIVIEKRKNRKEVVDHVIANGTLPTGVTALFTSMDQMSSAKNARDMVRMLSKTGNVVYIIDEAHNLAGESARGAFFQRLLTGDGLFGTIPQTNINIPPPAGWTAPPVMFLSATFAKRAGNMPTYARTDLGHLGTRDQIVQAFAGRGVAMTDVVSEMLVESGSMIRRERSYTGVGFHTVIDEQNAPRDERLVDEVTSIMRQILRANQAFKAWANGAGRPVIDTLAPPGTVKQARPAGNGMQAKMAVGDFASVFHNVIEQLLFATKVDSLVEQTVKGLNGELHADGKSQKIFIAFKNTMESMIDDYMEYANLKDGDDVGDFGWQHVIARSSNGAHRITYDKPNRARGAPATKHNTIRVIVPYNAMPALVAQEFQRVEQMLNGFSSTLPASPVDMLVQKLEQYSVLTKGDQVRVVKLGPNQEAEAGWSARPLAVGEISARGKSIDYMGETRRIRNRKRQDTRSVVGGFNNGTIDVMLANAAGSTGLSVHAGVKFRDQRPRHMLIAQPNPDIAVFKQTTGRIHRTGQVEWPDFTVFATGIPAERRALAMLKKKVGILMAGTTAGKGTTQINATDFINDYGDMVVNEYLRGNTEVAQFMNERPLANDEDAAGTDLARTVTNKAALLPSDQQRAMFDFIEEKYNDLIAARNATGTNELERKFEDLQAEMDPNEYRLVEDGIDENNPFLRAVVLAKYTTQVRGEVPTPASVRAAIDQELNGREPGKVVDDIEKSLKTAYDASLATLHARLTEIASELSNPAVTPAENQALVARQRAINSMLVDAGTTKDRTLRLLRDTYPVGAAIRELDYAGFPSQAIVIGYRVSKQAASGHGNPFSPSNISIVVQRNTPGGALSIPLSQMNPESRASIAQVEGWKKASDVLDDWFSLRYVGGGTEKRWIMTGNLPRGRVLVPGGDVIKFSLANEPDPVNGIRFPKNFDPGTAGQAQYAQIRYPESAREYMLAILQKMWAGRYGFEDRLKKVESMRVHPEIDLPEADYQNIIGADSTLVRGNGWRMTRGYDGVRVFTQNRDKRISDLLGDMPRRNGIFSTLNTVNDPEKIVQALQILAGNGATTAAMEANDFVTKLVQAHYYDTNPGAKPQASGAPRMGRSQQPPIGTERVQQIADKVSAIWKNGPKVEVVNAVEDLPQSARDELTSLSSQAGAEPNGYFEPSTGTIYLVASNIRSDAEALKVLTHEAVGHFGMRAVFGSEFASLLDNFITAADKRVREMAARLGYDYNVLADRRAAAEEVLAYMAENNPSYGWLRKFIATIAGWARKVIPGLSLTKAEIIRDFIAPAQKWIAGERAAAPQPAPVEGGRARILDVLRNAGGGPKIVGQRTTGRTYSAEQLRAMRNTGMLVDKPTLEQRVQSLWSNAGRKIAQGMFDQFAPIKEISKEAYALLRLSKGAAGAFEAMLKGGMLKITDNVYDFDTDRKGGVLDRLLKPLQGEHHDMLRWVAANRAEGLMAQDREHLFSEQDIEDLKTLSDGTTNFDYTLQHNINGRRAGTVTRDRTLIYQDAAKTLDEFNKNALDMAEQSGLIDAESRKIWEQEFYVPFYRVVDDTGTVAGGNIKSGVVRQEAIKHLKGGTQKLNADLLDSVLMNWAHLLDASAKNRAASASLKALVDTKHAYESTETAARQAAKSMGMKDNVVWVKDDGVKHFYVVDDPAYLQALTSMEYAGLRGGVMDVMGGLKRALTIGVTASPFFKVRNLIRDSIQAIATAPIGYSPIENVAEGWKLSNQTSDAYFRLLASGGTIHFGTMLEGSESKRVQSLVESGIADSTILDSDAKYKAFYRKHIEPWITAYNELGNRGETVNRASLYAQLRKQGLSHAEASLQARDLMDFSMQGTWTAIRFLAQVVPFWNARLQGLYKLGRAAKEDPQRFATVVGATALAGLALMLAYSDDDDWKRREDWDKNNYWWFKIGGTAFRIPKPFEVGAIATLAERGFELFFDRDMTGKRFRSNVLNILSDQLSMNPIPQVVKPMLGIYANVDSFTGRPIETVGQQNLAPQYRYNAGTSMTARATSTALNTVASWFGGQSLSPVQVDYLLQGYFAWLGTFTLQAADILARPLTGQPVRPERDWLKTATGGMAADLNDAQSRYISQMYEQGKAIEQAYHDYRTMMREGRTQEAAEIMQEHRQELAEYHRLERAKSIETKLNLRQRQIEQDQSMSATEKRDKLREILRTRERIARPVTEAIQ